MKYQELAILLPCHSLEDFPTHHEGDDAEGLLACWTALWHPALLAAAQATPKWHRVDFPPEVLAGKLIVVPTASQQQLPTGFAQRAKSEEAHLIRGKHLREEIVASALENLDGGAGTVDPDLAADFLALGFCFLQIQLLTRQMRYSSNLDEIHFAKQAVAAANAAMQGNETEAREKLTACFDLLGEERDHYYSVDAYVLDFTMLAPTTLGQSLRDELASAAPVNLLLTAELAALMAEKEPGTLAALQEALARGTVGLIGGEVSERCLPLMPCEAILGELRRGKAEYERRLGRRVEVFGRRRFGLTSLLPQILSKLGYRGALHATLEDGIFPQGGQTKIRWESLDGASLPAIAKTPLDATKPETYLKYASRLGETIDHDHVATICLAHWPGQRSRWYDDLRRIAKYGKLLGKFVTIEQYFCDTAESGQTERFEADQYRSPYLKQAVIRRDDDPLSRSVRFWQHRALAEAAQTMSTLDDLIARESGSGSSVATDLLGEIDQAVERADAGNLSERAAQAVFTAAERLARHQPHKPGATQTGYLVLNPFSFSRRVTLETPQLATLPTVEAAVVAAVEAGLSKQVIVDVPPFGFAWLTGSGKPAPKMKRAVPVAEDGVLRNEFFEVLINDTTGTLQSIHEYKSRGNRMSQQLAFRLPGARAKPGDTWEEPDESAAYSVMAADSVEVTASSALFGEITATGRLLDRQGKLLAGFRQVYQLWRGSRVLSLEIELDPQEEPKSDAWNSYYACRFAWVDEAAELWRAVNQTHQHAENKRLEAPQYIDIDDAKGRTTILTGGLPYHRRVGLRMLDSLLIVRGERARKFRLGIGLELTHPMQDAMGFLLPPPIVCQSAAEPTAGKAGWLFHIDAKNVIVTSCQPIVREGQVAGFRLRLLETTGRPARVNLSSFRPVSSARLVNFQGEPLGDCQMENGKIRIELAAHEWTEVEATLA